ncbi:MAG: hypothetical protein VX359_01335 [Chloroflexota bacterium]
MIPDQDSKPIFGTDGWRALIGDQFNIENCLLIVKSLISINKNKKLKIVVGYDTRFLSNEIAHAISRYLLNQGIDVILSDQPIPTPIVSFTVKDLNCDFGIIVTASHNAALWNGIKIKNSKGQSIDENTVKSLTRQLNHTNLRDDDIKNLSSSGELIIDTGYEKNLIQPYISSIERLVNLQNIRTKKLNIIVDCMFGTSISIMEKILGGNNCNIIEINNKPNPNFPGIKQPEPIDENLSRLKNLVKELDADIGFGFDADSDRVGVIDSTSKYIDSPYVFCSIAEHVLNTRKEKSSICTTVSMTSMIDRIAKKHSIDCFRTKIGFKYVAPAMEQNKSILGGEESGGYSYSPHLLERDGVMSALLLLEQLSSSKLDSHSMFKEQNSIYGELFFRRSDIHLNDKLRSQLTSFIEKFEGKSIIGKTINSIDRTDGLKIAFDNDQWILLRLSGTEPVARIYVESQTKKELANCIDDFTDFVTHSKF